MGSNRPEGISLSNTAGKVYILEDLIPRRGVGGEFFKLFRGSSSNSDNIFD